MRTGVSAALAGMVLAVALGGCGSDTTRLETGRQAVGEVKRMVGGVFGKRKAGGAAPDAQQLARDGMAANAGPLLLATLEKTKSTSIFALRGESGAMRTWMSPAEQALITRAGMLVGTRGFGFDIMSADAGALSALVHGRRAGQADLVLRYLDGLGKERPLPLRCTTGTGAATRYDFAGMAFSGTPVAAHCTGYGQSFDASYIVAASGEIVSSRQWIGPQLGYVTIQSLRN